MQQPSAPPKPSTETSPVPRYDARSLLKSGDVAEIALDEQIYTLRITRAGKLILTK